MSNPTTAPNYNFWEEFSPRAVPWKDRPFPIRVVGYEHRRAPSEVDYIQLNQSLWDNRDSILRNPDVVSDTGFELHLFSNYVTAFRAQCFMAAALRNAGHRVMKHSPEKEEDRGPHVVISPNNEAPYTIKYKGVIYFVVDISYYETTTASKMVQIFDWREWAGDELEHDRGTAPDRESFDELITEFSRLVGIALERPDPKERIVSFISSFMTRAHNESLEKAAIIAASDQTQPRQIFPTLRLREVVDHGSQQKADLIRELKLPLP